MGLRYTRTGGGSLNGEEYFKMSANMRNIIEEELEDAGADGLQEARSFVETAGTGREWSGPFKDRDGTIRTGSGQGRVASANMLKALDYRTFRGKGVGLDVGWIHFWEEYFGAQDKGFEAGGFRPAQAVAGMGMLAHLRIYMRGKVDIAMDRSTERIVNGL